MDRVHLLLHSSLGGHLSCFLLLAAVNASVQIFHFYGISTAGLAAHTPPPRHLHDLGLPAPLSGGACRGQRAGHVQQSLSSPFELDVTVRVLQVVNVRRRGSPLPHFLKSVSPTPHSAHRASGSKAHILLQETYFCLIRMRRFFSLGSPSSVSHPSPPDHIFKKRSAALLRCESHI